MKMASRKSCSNLLVLLVVTFGLIGALSTVRAQEANPPPEDGIGTEQAPANAADGQAASDDSESQQSLGSLIAKSGMTGIAFMVILGLFSLVGATVAIERIVNTRRNKIIPTEFVTDLRALIEKGHHESDSFHELCLQWSSPISKVLSAGLLRSGRPLPEVEKSMEDAAAREMAALRGGIRPLNVIGNVAPLVGLLGTVLGMITAFRTASQAGLGKGELMAQGIYMALLTTAAGLTIAIPALLLAALLNAKVEKFFREIDEHLIETMPSFARMEAAVSISATPTDAADSGRTENPLMTAKGWKRRGRRQ